MNIIKGKEKFWSALVSGGFVAAISTLALYLASLPGMVDAPDKATIGSAITGLVAAFAAAFGAYIATNSEPTSISVPAEPAPDGAINPGD
jgi:hypothetical protein